MPNMSYCRFQNTSGDFTDCASAIDEMLNGEEIEKLEDREYHSAIGLITQARDLVALAKETLNIDDEDELTDADVVRFVEHLNECAETAREVNNDDE